MPSENFIVAGTSHYLKDLLPLLHEDPDFSETKSYIAENYFDGDRIYKYYADNLSPVHLIDEPDNEYDPKAIRVEIAGIKVGYIKKGSTSHVRNLLNDPTATVTAEFTGGPYKDVVVDEDDKVSVERGEYAYSIKLTISTGNSKQQNLDDGEKADRIVKPTANMPVQAEATVTHADNEQANNRVAKKKKVNPIWLWILALVYILLGLSISGVIYKIIAFAIAAILVWAAIKAKRKSKEE